MSRPAEQLLRVQNFMRLDATGSAPARARASSAPSATPTRRTCSRGPGATASWPNRTDPGGSRGLDDYFTRDFAHNIGAEIMGRNKFGPQRGPWEDHEWQGWWGDTPPFHTPVFVLTHHLRPTLHARRTPPSTSSTPHPPRRCAQAKAAADGKDVRLGGGVTTVREFLDADLVDTMHVAVAPVELGRGERLWDSPDELLDRFHLDRSPAPAA